MNIALADEFKLSETYLFSSQTINRKLPISCKNRSGKYGFQPLSICFRLVIGKTHVYWAILIIKKRFVKIRSGYGSNMFKIERGYLGRSSGLLVCWLSVNPSVPQILWRVLLLHLSTEWGILILRAYIGLRWEGYGNAICFNLQIKRIHKLIEKTVS